MIPSKEIIKSSTDLVNFWLDRMLKEEPIFINNKKWWVTRFLFRTSNFHLHLRDGDQKNRIVFFRNKNIWIPNKNFELSENKS